MATLLYIITLIRLSSETLYVKEDNEGSFVAQQYSEKHSRSSHKFDESEDVFDLEPRTRSRFSLPVKRFKNKSKKSNKSSIQTERLLGRNLDRNIDHCPLPLSPSPLSLSPSDGQHPEGILIKAEVYNDVSPVSLTSNNSDQIDMDGLGYREETVSPIESLDIGLPDYFSRDYKNMLERNFVNNHLNGNRSDDLQRSVMEIVQQCQVRS